MALMKVGTIEFSNDNRLKFILGPCVIESLEHLETMASRLIEVQKTYDIELIFKASFDKANRSSVSSFRGVGIEMGLEYFAELKKKFPGLKTITDIHEPWQAFKVAEPIDGVFPVDIIQIPAFLSRQTDLVVEAARTLKPLLIKKAQFMSPYTDIEPLLDKISSVRSNLNVAICERGTTFGYNYLVNDFKGMIYMKNVLKVPVVYDATHSTQLPGAGRGYSKGNKEYSVDLAASAAALGISGIFAEVHDNPEKAKSDAATVISFDQLDRLIKKSLAIDSVVKEISRWQ